MYCLKRYFIVFQYIQLDFSSSVLHNGQVIFETYYLYYFLNFWKYNNSEPHSTLMSDSNQCVESDRKEEPTTNNKRIIVIPKEDWYNLDCDFLTKYRVASSDWAQIEAESLMDTDGMEIATREPGEVEEEDLDDLFL